MPPPSRFRLTAPRSLLNPCEPSPTTCSPAIQTYLLTILRQGRNSTSEIHAFNSKRRQTSFYDSASRKASFAVQAVQDDRDGIPLPSGGLSVTWNQVYDPLGHWWLSTLVAALPVVVLLGLLAALKVRARLCPVPGAATAILCAILVFHMPAQMAVSSFLYGSAYGLLKIVWIVIAAVFLYDISVETGQFEIMKQSVAAITPDRRLQLLLVAFCFGAFIEGCAGFGAPVAIAGAFMIGLGFKPFQAAALNLIANTSPVAWGAIGTPVPMLAAVTLLPEADMNAMIGRILPITAIIVPFWLVRAMVPWQETFEVLPAIFVVGISFAFMQYFWSNHMDSNLVDITAGLFSLLCTVIFLLFWKPKKIWRFAEDAEPPVAGAVVPAAATARAMYSAQPALTSSSDYSKSQILKAWIPFLRSEEHTSE